VERQRIHSKLKVRAWQLAVVVSLTGLRAVSASAQVSSSYDVWNCLGEDHASNKRQAPSQGLSQTTSSKGVHTLTNVSGGTQNVWCPIPRTTSGPGITNDLFYSLQVPIQTSGTVNCFINVWDTTITTYLDSASNSIYGWTGSLSTSGTLTVTNLGYYPDDYWDGNGTGSDWYYMDFTCELPNGASMQSYTVQEWGTKQSTARIYPAANCQNDPNDNIPWEYQPFPDPTQNGPGGFLYAEAGTGPFEFDCPVSTNVTVNFAVVPPTGGSNNVLGCKIENAALGTVTNPSLDWFVRGVSGFESTQILGPISTGSSHRMLWCGTPDPDGDGSIVSYRER
jgi:hypothetical protein